jgi:hypothetical protein
MTYKEVDLFGNETIRFFKSNKKRVDLFSDHDAFVEKFEIKKTTDDCYTPKEVYQIVLDYVNENFDLTGKVIIRPFFPGGDFEGIDYPENCVIIDNPPFSIIAKITRFYIAKNIPFFLFAPHLTLFGSDVDCTHVVVGGNVIYDNGAVVKTSFLSNMFGDVKIIGDADLLKKFKQLEEMNKTNLPVYKYPNNVLTVSAVQWVIEKGVSVRFDKKDVKHCRGLQSQKVQKKAIFGSGFLISDRAAAEKAAAERAAAERAAAEKAAAEKINVFEWELSPKELKTIKSLG